MIFISWIQWIRSIKILLYPHHSMGGYIGKQWVAFMDSCLYPIGKFSKHFWITQEKAFLKR